MNTAFRSKALGLFLLTLPPLLSAASAHTHDANQAHDSGDKEAYYLAEHGDFGVGFENGHLDLHIHLHAGAVVDGNALAEDAAFDPDELIVVATHEAEVLRPAGQAWDCTGVEVNEPIWVLPQHGQERLPAFGLATEEIAGGLFADDLVILHLRHLKGPGDLTLWTNDAFGRPTFLLSSHDRVLTVPLPVGMHMHCNWGFTQPGTYTAVFEVTGELADGGNPCALAVCTFLICDTLIVLDTLDGDVNRDGVVDEIDLVIVEDNLGRTARVWPEPEGN